MSVVIDIHDLYKRFGDMHALSGLDLQVREGDVHGFLGPNGSGKTTTIRILLGILQATSGHVRLLGGDPWYDAVSLHRKIAYVPGDVTLWPSLTGGDTIDLLGRMRGGIDGRRRSQLIERFDLDPTKKARTYSKGNRQKVVLISALSSRAQLLLLDEPSSGLDPLMEHVFRDCVREARDRGVTVLVSTHILSEMDALCERVTIIRSGETVESGTLESMRHLSRMTIRAELLGDPRGLDRLTAVPTPLPAGNGEGHSPIPRRGPRMTSATLYRADHCSGAPNRNPFTGTLGLLRLYMRRDRIVLPLWVMLLSLPLAPIYNDGLGAVGIWKPSLFQTMVAVAVILTVIRHTRAEEEASRSELLQSTAIGRYSNLTAAVLLAAGASITTGALAIASLLTNPVPLAGSLAFGLALAGSGLVFTAVGAFVAQLSPTARTARGIAFAMLGCAFALRAIGDAGNGRLSWLSPLGWSLQVRPFAGERWWVLLLHVTATLAMVVAAYLLLHARDLGSGLISERPHRVSRISAPRSALETQPDDPLSVTNRVTARSIPRASSSTSGAASKSAVIPNTSSST